MSLPTPFLTCGPGSCAQTRGDDACRVTASPVDVVDQMGDPVASSDG